jgi:hypothetical protein
MLVYFLIIGYKIYYFLRIIQNKLFLQFIIKQITFKHNLKHIKISANMITVESILHKFRNN